MNLRGNDHWNCKMLYQGIVNDWFVKPFYRSDFCHAIRFKFVTQKWDSSAVYCYVLRCNNNIKEFSLLLVCFAFIFCRQLTLICYIKVDFSFRLLVACSRRSDSGAQRKERGGKWSPRLFFARRSLHCAPLSERLEQASLLNYVHCDVEFVISRFCSIYFTVILARPKKLYCLLYWGLHCIS